VLPNSSSTSIAHPFHPRLRFLGLAGGADASAAPPASVPVTDPAVLGPASGCGVSDAGIGAGEEVLSAGRPVGGGVAVDAVERNARVDCRVVVNGERGGGDDVTAAAARLRDDKPEPVDDDPTAFC